MEPGGSDASVNNVPSVELLSTMVFIFRSESVETGVPARSPAVKTSTSGRPSFSTPFVSATIVSAMMAARSPGALRLLARVANSGRRHTLAVANLKLLRDDGDQAGISDDE